MLYQAWESLWKTEFVILRYKGSIQGLLYPSAEIYGIQVESHCKWINQGSNFIHYIYLQGIFIRKVGEDGISQNLGFSLLKTIHVHLSHMYVLYIWIIYSLYEYPCTVSLSIYIFMMYVQYTVYSILSVYIHELCPISGFGADSTSMLQKNQAWWYSSGSIQWIFPSLEWLESRMCGWEDSSGRSI